MSFDKTYWNRKLNDAFTEAFEELKKQHEFYRLKYELKTMEDFATVCHENVMLKSRVEHLEKQLELLK